MFQDQQLIFLHFQKLPGYHLFFTKSPSFTKISTIRGEEPNWLIGAANCLISPEGESWPSAATAVIVGIISAVISSLNFELDLLFPEQEIIPRDIGVNNKK